LLHELAILNQQIPKFLLVLVGSLARVSQLLDLGLHGSDLLILLLVEILFNLVHLGLSFVGNFAVDKFVVFFLLTGHL
jgi:hypothetical protein